MEGPLSKLSHDSLRNLRCPLMIYNAVLNIKDSIRQLLRQRSSVVPDRAAQRLAVVHNLFHRTDRSSCTRA